MKLTSRRLLLILSLAFSAGSLTAQSTPGEYPDWIGDASLRGSSPSSKPSLQGGREYPPDFHRTDLDTSQPTDSDAIGFNTPSDARPNLAKAPELTAIEERSAGPVSAEQLRHPLSGKALTLIRKAQKLIDARKHPQAIETLRSGLSLPAAAPYAYSLLGQEYIRMWDFEEAVPALQQAVHLLPANAVDHANLGFAQMMRGQLNPAEGELLRALELQPANPQTHLSLGILRLCQGAHETEAEEQFKIAARELPVGHLMLAKFYKLTERPAAAEEHFQTYLKVTGTSENPGLRHWLDN